MKHALFSCCTTAQIGGYMVIECYRHTKLRWSSVCRSQHTTDFCQILPEGHVMSGFQSPLGQASTDLPGPSPILTRPAKKGWRNRMLNREGLQKNYSYYHTHSITIIQYPPCKKPMEVEFTPCWLRNIVFQGAIVHFRDCFRECAKVPGAVFGSPAPGELVAFA